MSEQITILAAAAATLGFVHTILGPDHYIPFIVMSKAGKWSMLKTTVITVLCGIGHVGSSIIIGMIGIGFGMALGNIEEIESIRGSIAGWAMISFGLVYMIWGIRKAYKNKPHTHFHTHSDGTIHSHEHNHREEHSHVHEKENVVSITPWVLFTIFVFGPCEVLIPILMYPAATESTFGLILVTSIFALTTIGTMLAIVLVSSYGLSLIPFTKLTRYTHALAGLIILFSGLAIEVLGL